MPTRSGWPPAARMPSAMRKHWEHRLHAAWVGPTFQHEY